MAFRKTLAKRLFNISKITAPNSLCSCRVSSPSTAVKSLTSGDPDGIPSDQGNDGMFKRFLHRRPAYGYPGILPELWSLKGGNIVNDRIRLDMLSPPATPAAETVEEAALGKLTAEDARKLLMLAQLEMVKIKLRNLEKSCVKYDEFIGLCNTTSFGGDQSLEVAKMLDQSGTVIVLGDVVFIRPEQVMKAIKGLVPKPTATQCDPRMKEELAAMEKQKLFIDERADSLVRKELWCGLGYLVIQTAAFMRLTFWELTWDVMEPICFYVTSMYFMAGYAFFLQTSKEPSFEGFFRARFDAKQRKLMKVHNFDFERYNELRKACYGDVSMELKGSETITSKLGDLNDHALR